MTEKAAKLLKDTFSTATWNGDLILLIAYLLSFFSENSIFSIQLNTTLLPL